VWVDFIGEGGLKGTHFFDYCLEVLVFLGCGAGFGAEGGEVVEDFVVGEHGGLGFEDLLGNC